MLDSEMTNTEESLLDENSKISDSFGSDKLIMEEYETSCLDRILGRDFDLPMLPHVALKVIRLTANPNTSTNDIAKIIMTDQTIAVKILDICNSPVYAAAVKIDNISQAIVRLGLQEIKDLMLAISMKSRIFNSDIFGRQAKELWEHSISCALASRIIARNLDVAREDAFLGGLMHDLGKMVLVGVLESTLVQFRQQYKDFMPTEHLIGEILQTHHADVGEMVGIKWTLPEVISDVICKHHDIAGMESANTLVRVVYLGNKIVHLHQEDIPLEMSDLADDSVVKMLGIPADVLSTLVEQFKESIEAASGELF